MAVKREQVVQTAEKYVARGKIEPAIREYRKLLEENPNDINTLNRVGDLYARIQRIDEAVDFFNQIAEQYASEGFFVKAIAIYKKIIKLDPTRLDVYESLAELYHRQGLVTEARTQYQVLADYYQKHENATSTIAIYQKMAELEPNNPTYHVKLAELYQQQQLVDKAMGEYRIIAELMIEHGHPQEAGQVYERALAIDSSNLGFISDAALKLKTAAGPAVAARFLAAAVERNPQALQVARLVGGAAGLGGTYSGVPAAGAPVPPAAEAPQDLGDESAVRRAPRPSRLPAGGAPAARTGPDAAPAAAAPAGAGRGVPPDMGVPDDDDAYEPYGRARALLEDDDASPAAAMAAAAAAVPDAAGAPLEVDFEEIELDLGSDLILDEDLGAPATAADLPPLAAGPDPYLSASPAAAGSAFDAAFEIDEAPAQGLPYAPRPPASAPATGGAGAQPGLSGAAAAAAAAAHQTGGPRAAGGEADHGAADFDDVFVLDIEDDEEPASLVKPPPDMLSEPRRPSWAQGSMPASPAAPAVRAAAGPAAAPAPAGPPAPPAPPAPPEDAGTEFDLLELPELGDLPDLSDLEMAAPPFHPAAEAGPAVPADIPAGPGGGRGPQAGLPATPAGPDEGRWPAAGTSAGPAGAEEGRWPPGAPAAAPAGSQGARPPAEPSGQLLSPLPAEMDHELPPFSSGEYPAVPDSAAPPEPVLQIDSDLLERTAAELLPQTSERYEDLVSEAEVLAKYGLEEKAAERLRDAIRIKPRQFAAYLLLIQLQLDKGRPTRVIDLANQVAQLAADLGDHDTWPKLRKRLLAAGYRVDGDRVTAAPRSAAALAASPAAPGGFAAASAAASAEAAAAASAAAAPGMVPPRPPAAPPSAGAAGAAGTGGPPTPSGSPGAAAGPAAAGRPGQRGRPAGGIDQMLEGLIEPRGRRAPRARPADSAAGAPPAPPATAGAAAPAAGGAPAVPAAAAMPAAPPSGGLPPESVGGLPPESAAGRVQRGSAAGGVPPGFASEGVPAASAVPSAPAGSEVGAAPFPGAAPAGLPLAGAPAGSPISGAAGSAGATGAADVPPFDQAAPPPSAELIAEAAALLGASSSSGFEPPADGGVPAGFPPQAAGQRHASGGVGDAGAAAPFPAGGMAPLGGLAPGGRAGAGAIELPPLVAAEPEAAPEAPVSIFNPLDIGAMVESEEIDWDDHRPMPGLGQGQGTAGYVMPPSFAGGSASASHGAAGGNGAPGAPGAPGADTAAASPAAPAPGAGGTASGGAASLDDTGMSWLDEADSGKDRLAARAASLFDDEADFFDLAGELEQELSREPVFQGEDMLVQQEQSLEEIVEGFKRGVAEHLSPTDYDTHFNLGIAYREMGLLDEAIGEFQVSAKDARYLVSCCSMLGLCFMDKGLPELAIKWYHRGLEATGISEEDTLGLLYDMGCAHLAMGDNAGAYKTFVDVYGINTNYRDVVARIEELGRPH